MKISYSTRFLREYRKLSISVKRSAEQKEIIFRQDPFDSRLQTHKLKGGLAGFWSSSISKQDRIIFEFIKKEVWFHSVGSHDIYKLWD